MDYFFDEIVKENGAEAKDIRLDKKALRRMRTVCEKASANFPQHLLLQLNFNIRKLNLRLKLLKPNLMKSIRNFLSNA